MRLAVILLVRPTGFETLHARSGVKTAAKRRALTGCSFLQTAQKSKGGKTDG